MFVCLFARTDRIGLDPGDERKLRGTGSNRRRKTDHKRIYFLIKGKIIKNSNY